MDGPPVSRHFLVSMLVRLRLGTAAVLLASFLGLVSDATAAVIHYPPTASNINNLTFVLSGSGSPGIFDSSSTPDKQYGEYNWCNMPHVRTREYKSVIILTKTLFLLTTLTTIEPRQRILRLNMWRLFRDTTSARHMHPTPSSKRTSLGVAPDKALSSVLKRELVEYKIGCNRTLVDS